MRNILISIAITLVLVYMLDSPIMLQTVDAAKSSDKISVQEYTPFDEIVITIFSPDSNQNHDVIDSIEARVSSSSDSIGRVKFVETGPNTGIFDLEIKLTPNKKMFPGELEVKREDGITVEFRIDENTVVTKSVFVNYHVGLVSFDKEAYKMNDTAIVRVIDPDLNMHPNTIDTVKIRLWSTTDRGGLLVTLRETGDRTGVFEEIVTFTQDEESSGTRLRVSEGDTITAKYSDNTLPAPAALDADGVFTVEVRENFALANIGSILPPLERVSISEVELLDQKGNQLTEINVGMQVLMQSTVTNAQMKKQSFAYIVQVTNADGITVSLAWISGEIPAKESLKVAQSWIPSAKGDYKVEVFVWESIDNPMVLSAIRSATVTVGVKTGTNAITLRTVDEETKNSVVDATVTISDKDGKIVFTKATDRNGEVKLVLRNGDYIITIQATTYEKIKEALQIDQDMQITFELPRRCTGLYPISCSPPAR